jgi:hypothetical protein
VPQPSFQIPHESCHKFVGNPSQDGPPTVLAGTFPSHNEQLKETWRDFLPLQVLLSFVQRSWYNDNDPQHRGRPS